jgi:hypothetical protein
MKSIKIKGKDYVTVTERIKYLSTEFEGDYSIQTDYQFYPDFKMFVVKATLSVCKDGVCSTYNGLAQETMSERPNDVNFAKALENAETSAIGRACAFAGIGIVDNLPNSEDGSKAGNKDDDGRPWLQEKEFHKMLEFIETGEESKIDAVRKSLSKYKMKRDYRDALEKALNHLKTDA